MSVGLLMELQVADADPGGRPAPPPRAGKPDQGMSGTGAFDLSLFPFLLDLSCAEIGLQHLFALSCQ